jgi:hypothetical protein
MGKLPFVIRLIYKKSSEVKTTYISATYIYEFMPKPFTKVIRIYKTEISLH